MLVNIVTSLLGILILLFVFWKRLREDYAPEIIFKSAFYILTGLLIGYLVALKFLPPAFLWFAFLGSIAGLAISSYWLKMRFYETFETEVLASIPWLAFMFLADSVKNSSLNSFLAFVATLFLILIAYYLDTHYKEFTWYKSGKIGFSGLAILVIIFGIRTALAIQRISVLSFLGKFEAVISGAAALISLVLLVNLGRKNER